mmetsp:Transcript_23767/g.74880  ORF Transcript_23767/g.74880 Transcript_23767/m.74880 type:complete len:200 (-) Transcript_23767:49-648(-)
MSTTWGRFLASCSTAGRPRVEALVALSIAVSRCWEWSSPFRPYPSAKRTKTSPGSLGTAPSHTRGTSTASLCGSTGRRWLGFTPLTTFDISKVVEHLERTWLAKDYHCLRRNCTDFAEQMALELCAPRPFPRWAHGVAKSSLLAGGCCTPLVAKTPGARFLAPCCSSWGSTGTLLGTPRSSYITADVHYSVQEDGPWDI